MKNQGVVALDVGGTTIDSTCIAQDGRLLGKLVESHSPATETSERIVDALVEAIENGRQQGTGTNITACGIAMPAPFDYEAGVSHMVHKFQAIHGLELKQILQEKTKLPIYFVNDADAFALGVGWQQIPRAIRFIALTIGTGIGAGFVENNALVLTDGRVPLNGEVWDLPYKDGILEDYVSARAVVAHYYGAESDGLHTSKEVAELALQGDQSAIQAFQAIGTELGQGLAETCAHFAPEQIVIGGKIARSLELYIEPLRQALSTAGVPVPKVVRAMPGNMAIWGAAKHALMSMGGGF